MYSLVFLGLTSFLLALLLTPMVRNTFRRWGFVDYPGEGRHIHHAPIPRVGGVAIVLAYVLSYGFLFAINLKAGLIIWDSLAESGRYGWRPPDGGAAGLPSPPPGTPIRATAPCLTRRPGSAP
jgi:UDP-N-acetylmuramyl pentapeptide phosphotransferase/UDP-N-acetylglucosamine-1-phosphate transferase